MVLVAHALQNEEPIRKIRLGDNYGGSLLPTFTFNNTQCRFSFSYGDMLEYHRVSPHDWLGIVLCNIIDN